MVTVESAGKSVDQAAPAGWGQRLALLRREVTAGLPFGLQLLPTCLAAGVLAYSPLGPDFAAAGVTAGLATIIFGGICAAIVGYAGFVISSPRTNLALMQATAAGHFMSNGALAHDPFAVLAALALTILAAGLLQMLFAVAGIVRIIKYTPHTVLVGFTNGVALSIIISVLGRYIDIRGAQQGAFPFLSQPLTLLFIVGLALLIFLLGSLSKKIPAAILGLAVGTTAFYAVHLLAPHTDLGRTIGHLGVTVPPASPLAHLSSPEIRDAILSVAPNIVLIALAIAVIATFECLLVFRMAGNLADEHFGSMRSLVGQGAGNIASALAGGLAFSAASGQTRSAFRAGGRTRIVPITVGTTILLLTTLAPAVLAVVPVAAILGLLLQNTFQNFDRSSLHLLRQTITAPASPERRRNIYDLLVIASVMGVTVGFSVLPGVLAGVVVACIIFIVNMSRPIVRRRVSGATLFSKRTRSIADSELLHATGCRRIVLELHGVLFFGNADDLSHTATELFAEADVIILDLRGVSDIDATGANILQGLAERSRRRGKRLLFCNVPATEAETVVKITAGSNEPAIFADLDTTLEWAENLALRSAESRRGAPDVLPLDRHDLMHGLDAGERAVLAALLTRREFSAGEVLCTEGDDATSMWLLMKGSVSVRLHVSDPRASRRLASCGPGTTVGEMAFVEQVRRSASVVANEDTVCYELDRAAFDAIAGSHPRVATKLLLNVACDLARRLRSTSADLRDAVS